MQITVETVGACRKRIQLFVPPERIKKEVDDFLRNAAQNLRLPGFRPGHIPRSLVEKRYGQAIRHDVKESLVNDGYQQAIKEHNILPMSSPQVDIEAIPLDEVNGMKVDFELDTRPEFEVKDYKGVAVKLKPVTVTDEDLEKQIQEVRTMRSRPVKDDAAAMDANAFAIAALEFKVGDKVVLKRESVRVRLGMGINGADLEEFQKLLTGKKVGDTFDIALTYPPDFEVTEAAEQKGTCQVTLREVYRLEPPTDEELLKDLDMPDQDTFRKDVRRRMIEAREHHERRRAEEELVERAVAANPFDIPERLIEQQVESRVAQQKAQAETAPSDAEVAEFRTKVKPDMEKGLRRLFVLEAIARKEKLFVTEDDLMAELRSIAERNQSTLEEVAHYYQQQNLLPAMRLDLLENKVRSFLYENAERSTAA